MVASTWPCVKASASSCGFSASFFLTREIGPHQLRRLRHRVSDRGGARQRGAARRRGVPDPATRRAHREGLRPDLQPADPHLRGGGGGRRGAELRAALRARQPCVRHPATDHADQPAAQRAVGAGAGQDRASFPLQGDGLGGARRRPAALHRLAGHRLHLVRDGMGARHRLHLLAGLPAFRQPHHRQLRAALGVVHRSREGAPSLRHLLRRRRHLRSAA